MFASHSLLWRGWVLECDTTLCPEKEIKKGQNFGVPTQDKALKLFQSRRGRRAAAAISRPREYFCPCRARSGSGTAQPSPCLAPPRSPRRGSQVHLPRRSWGSHRAGQALLSHPGSLTGGLNFNTGGSGEPRRGAQRGSPAPPEQRSLGRRHPSRPPGLLPCQKRLPNLPPEVGSLSFHFSNVHAVVWCPWVVQRCTPGKAGHAFHHA